jgi:transcriptional regulator
MSFVPADPHRAATMLIERYPLAWVVSRGFNASPLPLLAECDANGALVALFGHCGRTNPLVADLREDERGLILCNGPAGYIPPALVTTDDWAPTWNFATLRIEVDIAFVGDETETSVERLLDHMERAAPGRWSTAALGARRDALLSRIIAFRATVRHLDVRFKLGQDERPAILDQIVAGHADRTLAAWMDQFGREA